MGDPPSSRVLGATEGEGAHGYNIYLEIGEMGEWLKPPVC